jgi:hypothetical protein
MRASRGESPIFIRFKLSLTSCCAPPKVAHNAVLDIEELSVEELDEMKYAYSELAGQAIEDAKNGKSDCGAPEVRGKARA